MKTYNYPSVATFMLAACIITGSTAINLGTGAALSFANSSAVDQSGGTLNITVTLSLRLNPTGKTFARIKVTP